MARCRDQVDVIVTDSPLLLSYFYNKNPILGKDFQRVVTNVYNSYTNLNYFVKRHKKYNPIGRNQTEDEAKALDLDILDFLEYNDLKVKFVDGNKDGYDNIVIDVLNKISDINSGN